MARSSLFAAGLVASVAGGAWGAAGFTIAMAMGGGAWRDIFVALQLFGMAFAYGGVVAFVLTWTVGLAWHVAAHRLGWRSFAAYAAAGTATGLALSLLAVSMIAASPQTDAFMIIYLSSCTVIVSVVGWLIRRPDRDASANPPTSAT